MKISVLVFASSCLFSAVPSSAQTNLAFLGIDPLRPVIRNGVPNADGDFEPMRFTGIVPDRDQTQNFSLNRAFRITGNISGGQAAFLAAIRDDGAIFSGVVNASSGNYAVVVPMGTYRVKVCYGSPTTATYDDPAPVTVSADTTRDEALPPITSYPVSGSVTGLDPSAFGNIAFAAQDGSSGSSGFIFPGLGTYSVNLPSGNYNASVLQLNFSTGGISIFPVGTVTVVDTAVTMNFAIGPTAQLSGTVMKSSIPPNSAMLALETTLMPPTGFSCLSNQVSTGLSPVDQGSGAYQMTLLTGRSYFLLGSFPILPADPPQTAATYQWVDPSTVDFQGDTVRDAAVSPPAGTIAVTGQVTVGGGPDRIGDAIANALADAVCTRSSSGTTAPTTAFARGTQTDSGGNYRLVLPQDPSFQCTITVRGPQPSPP